MTPARDSFRRHHHDPRRPASLLLFAAALTGAACAVEVWGGLRSGSLALLSDAGHAFMDFTALLLSLFAARLAARPVTDRRTYGLHRLEVMAAVLNGLWVVGLAVWIAAASLRRMVGPRPVDADTMLGVGLFGLLVNLAVAWRLRGHTRDDLNIRGAFLHVVSDAVASVGVVLGAVTLRLTGWAPIDPLVGLIIAAVILLNAGALLKDAFNLLLEGVPRGVDLGTVAAALRSVPGVVRVDDLHVWGLCSHLASLSAHIVVDGEAAPRSKDLLRRLNDILRERFNLTHTTLQMESEGESPPGDAP